jgi:hypothetical protein
MPYDLLPEDPARIERAFWENCVTALLTDPRIKPDHAAELADQMLEEWRKRFKEKEATGPKP